MGLKSALTKHNMCTIGEGKTQATQTNVHVNKMVNIFCVLCEWGDAEQCCDRACARRVAYLINFTVLSRSPRMASFKLYANEGPERRGCWRGSRTAPAACSSTGILERSSSPNVTVT